MKVFALFTLVLGFSFTVVVSAAINNGPTPTQAWEQSNNLKAELRQLEK